ncbi:cytochrome p450 [Hirsutella rhossiliensis]|uniref:Cytochrome p450 domain-containing protein n=1 Tax=Hirsutella rhossiliensis TaxID=111463 RepID=A0A9P8SLS6_9HYPO|nr:cytochrome p450 domain-containing protein [Hirsutella rhossiliensis]KAH0966095.1 cytochrome p450 domain-containing protein [Hirsutella rhossiliensis]
MQLSAIFAIALAAAAASLIYSRVRDALRHAARARELGCKPPVRGFSSEPTGLLGVFYGIRASRKHRFPDFVEEQMEALQQHVGRPVGTVTMRTPFFQDSIFTLDPRNVQAILATKFKDFKLGVNRTENFRPLLGNGIFAANGEQWQHSRALLRPQFVRSQVSDLDLEEAHVKALMTVLERHLLRDGWTTLLDLQELFFRLTLDSATEFLFGESVNSQLEHGAQGPAAKGNVSFAQAFDSSQFTLSFGARLGSQYWLVHTPAFKKQVARVHTFVNHFVEIAMVQGSGEKRQGSEKGDYVFLYALARETQDPEELRSQLLNILLAGRDTTASTLSWLFYTMADAQYQHIFQRLRGVIVDEFGTYSNPKDISFERMKSCQYLQWCINECLRLYPAVSVNVRTAETDTCLPTGGGPDGLDPVYVQKGQDVAYSVHVMHRRKDLWGPDAHVFRPERWQDRRPGWDYLPFNGGPRICIGQQFALTEIAYVVIRLMQRIDAMDGSRIGPVKHRLTLTNCPADGVNVRLHFAAS